MPHPGPFCHAVEKAVRKGYFSEHSMYVNVKREASYDEPDDAT